MPRVNRIVAAIPDRIELSTRDLNQPFVNFVLDSPQTAPQFYKVLILFLLDVIIEFLGAGHRVRRVLRLRPQLHGVLEGCSVERRGKMTLFSDNINDWNLRCGPIHGAYLTVDSGPGYRTQLDSYFAQKRKFSPAGPLVNSEFYPGWQIYWDHDVHHEPILNSVIDGTMYMFYLNASFNYYVSMEAPILDFGQDRKLRFP
ncbi:hypothetical protein L596_011841 [Steinernema carpocapsae]|uniref:Glycoside hydrolase 35 catalytic domain-containing protein n=1 Tax=Steinernema carpocapsae TaxID=34508 RepID=A0A4U5NW40_STECR|nr:hypothetical protein L596_011841 [Steinernema carpocapsae]